MPIDENNDEQFYQSESVCPPCSLILFLSELVHEREVNICTLRSIGIGFSEGGLPIGDQRTIRRLHAGTPTEVVGKPGGL